MTSPDRGLRLVGAPTVTLAVAAAELGVSTSTIRRWADGGRLTSVRTAGGHRRVAMDDVLRLSRQTTGRRAPLLRPTRLPDGSIDGLSTLISEEGGDLVRRAVAVLYAPGRAGWFADDAGVRELAAWLAAFHGAAARAARWQTVVEATRRLAAGARHAGAAPIEAHVLLQGIEDIVQFRLRERGATHATFFAVHRLFRALDRAMFEDRLNPP